MFIHIGGEQIIRTSEVVAIFDLSIKESSDISKQFTSYAEEQPNVEFINGEESKSLVITPHKLYFSPISASTLKKKSQSVSRIIDRRRLSK